MSRGAGQATVHGIEESDTTVWLTFTFTNKIVNEDPMLGYVRILTSGTVTVIWHGQTDFANMIKLKILRRRDHPGLPGWAQSDHKDPYKKEAGGSESQMEVGQCKQRRVGSCYPVGLEIGDEAMSQGWQSFLEAVKGKDIDYFLEPPKGTLPDWHLDLRSSDLLNCKIINSCCLRSLGLWLFVTTTIGNKYWGSIEG